MVSKSALPSESLDKVERKAPEKLQERSELPSRSHTRDQEAKPLYLTARRDEAPRTAPCWFWPWARKESQVWPCFRTPHVRGW